MVYACPPAKMTGPATFGFGLYGIVAPLGGLWNNCKKPIIIDSFYLNINIELNLETKSLWTIWYLNFLQNVTTSDTMAQNYLNLVLTIYKVEYFKALSTRAPNV